jgi:hypothetical protein
MADEATPPPEDEAEITDADLDEAAAFWRTHAPPPFRDLIDAEADDAANGSPDEDRSS